MGDDHSLDALSYGGMKVFSSPHIPDGKALVIDDKIIGSIKGLSLTMQNAASTAQDASKALGKIHKGLAGISADFVIYDELTDFDAASLTAVADGNVGVLRRAALKEIERREREQAELEATPGYGSF